MSHADESRIIDACDTAHEFDEMYGPGKARNKSIETLTAGVLLLERHAIASADLLSALVVLLDDYEHILSAYTTDHRSSVRENAVAAIRKAMQ